MNLPVKKTIALVGILSGGHHETYMIILSRVFLDLGYRVLALFPEPQELTEAIKFSHPDIGNNFQVATIQDPSISKNRTNSGNHHDMALRRWQISQEAVATAMRNGFSEPELVFITYLDIYLGSSISARAVDAVFSFPWNGIFFLPFYLRRRSPMDKLRVLTLPPHRALKSKNCTGVTILDEGIAETLQILIEPKKVTVFPDFTDESMIKDNELSKRLSNLKQGRKAIGLYGGLAKRKGLLTLLKAVETLPQDRYFLIIAGELFEHTFSRGEIDYIVKFQRKFSESAFFHFERIRDEAVYNSLVNECDVLFAAYNDFYHSANSLTKAALFEKPVIVSEGYCMADRVKDFNMGICIPAGDDKACARAFIELCQPEQKQNCASGLRKYASTHSVAELRRSVSFLLETK